MKVGTSHSNRAAQLPFLPGNTLSLVGPQVVVARVAPEQEQSLPAGWSVVHSAKSAPPSGIAHETNLAVCPDGQDSAGASVVQSPSVGAKGSVKVVVTRPFFGCSESEAVKVAGFVCFFVSLGQLPP